MNLRPLLVQYTLEISALIQRYLAPLRCILWGSNEKAALVSRTTLK